MANMKNPYDLWSTDLEPKTSLTDNELSSYYLRQLKKVQPKIPRTLEQPTSLLPKVELPHPGASYNPSYKHHQEYLATIAELEIKYQKKEEKYDKKYLLAPGDKFLTKEELLAEQLSGLPLPGIIAEEESTAVASDEDDDATVSHQPIAKARKTRTARRREKSCKMLMIAKQKEKNERKRLSEVFRIKGILSKLDKQQKKRTSLANLRVNKKRLELLTKTQQLGRGKFEPMEAPFVVTDELVGSLNQLKPQGSLIFERLNSMQKRNMLPVPGEKKKSRLKRKLRIKMPERRSRKEVTIGSRVI